MTRNPLRRRILAPALALALAPAALTAQGTAADPLLRQIDSLVAAAYPADGPGAAVLVARGDQVLLRKAYGQASIELGVAADPAHVFRIGSITKQFTAVAILMLADEGKLSLDDEITKFFPEWPTHGHRITVEHLLTHTSGIRSYTSLPEVMSQAARDLELPQLIAAFRDQPMDFVPGTDYRYNNSAYVLLGAIVERVSGQGYADFLRTRIFEPLGMRDTRYERPELIARRVPGYRGSPGNVRPAPPLSMTIPHAAGALVSTVDDQLRWQRAVAEGRLLRPETWRRAFTPFRLADGRSSGYGYGWFLGTAAGEATVEHGGDIHGFSSEGMWIPSKGVHVVVLANVDRGYANPNLLTVAIAERVVGTTGVVPAAALSPEALDAYVGVYAASPTEHRTVTREGSVLRSVRGTGVAQEMVPLGGDEFVYPESGTRVTFVRGEDGRVTGMRLRPRLGPDLPLAPRLSDAEAAALAAPAEIRLSAEVLERYVGRYQLSPELTLTVRREGDRLSAEPTGQAPRPLLARSMTRFAIEGVEDAAIEFQVGDDGSVGSLVFERGSSRRTAPRVP